MPDENSRTGILLFAHGSRIEEANRGVHELARQVQETGSLPYVRAAFLEMAQPDLTAAIEVAAQAGFGRILIIPFFLTMGVHLRRDLPELLAQQRKRHPGLKIQAGDSLEGHPLMPSLILDRVRAAGEACKERP